MSGKRSRSRWFVLLILTGVGLGVLLPVFLWQPVARGGDTEGEPLCMEEKAVDLDICYGQFGRELGEQEEDDPGSVTTANLNNTDGTGEDEADTGDDNVYKDVTSLPDGAAAGSKTLKVADISHYQKAAFDPIVIVEKDNTRGEIAYALLPHVDTGTLDLHEAIKNNYSSGSKIYRCGEVDLMRLILQKPNGPDEDQVTLSLVSGNARVWETPVKITEKKFPVTYTISQLPKVLWVEATDVSARVGDIELKLTYGTESDSVLATGVWAEHSARSPWHNRQAQDGFPDNPVPGAGFDLPDCTHPPLLDHINTAMATDGSRYGFGPWWKKQDGQGQWYDSHVGGRILLEFEVRPADAPGKLPITWDVTRQCEYRTHSLKKGQHTFATHGTNFPWKGYPPNFPVRDDEYPNDEMGQADNDNTPSNTRIYSWDSPGTGREADPFDTAFYVFRLTLKEWVRVQFDGGIFPNTSNHHKLGSRSSSKYGWHMCGHWKRDAAGNLALDGDLVSYSAPRFKEGVERGTVGVTLLGQAGTDGYTLDYAANDNKWTLTQLSNGDKDSDVQDPGNGVVWTLEIANRVRIQITQNGDDEYADGAQYTLGVYKTAQQSKVNEIEPGDFVVTGDP